MIALLQRVTSARVDVSGETVGEIGQGLLVLVGVEKEDGRTSADRMLQRLLGYRVFADEAGKMNLSVQNIEGGLLLVPQFTLAADTSSGMRPGFSTAASPETGREIFQYLLQQASEKHSPLASGRFGTDMAVSLVNDGPVTFSLKT